MIATVVSALAVIAPLFAPSASSKLAEERADQRGISIRSEAKRAELADHLDRGFDAEASLNFQDVALGNEAITRSIVPIRKGAKALKSVAPRSLNSAHELSHRTSGLGQEVSTFTSETEVA